jgi:hypothetical protein
MQSDSWIFKAWAGNRYCKDFVYVRIFCRMVEKNRNHSYLKYPTTISRDKNRINAMGTFTFRQFLIAMVLPGVKELS